MCLENGCSLLYITTVPNSYDALPETCLSFLLSFILLTDFENKTSVGERARGMRTTLKPEKKNVPIISPPPLPCAGDQQIPKDFVFICTHVDVLKEKWRVCEQATQSLNKSWKPGDIIFINLNNRHTLFFQSFSLHSTMLTYAPTCLIYFIT